MTHIKQQKYFHHPTGRGLLCIISIDLEVIKMFFCCFICVTLLWLLRVIEINRPGTSFASDDSLVILSFAPEKLYSVSCCVRQSKVSMGLPTGLLPTVKLYSIVSESQRSICRKSTVFRLLFTHPTESRLKPSQAGSPES